MALLALVFFVAAVLVWRTKRPAMPPRGSRLWRVDEVAVSTVLFFLSACMLFLEIAR